MKSHESDSVAVYFHLVQVCRPRRRRSSNVFCPLRLCYFIVCVFSLFFFVSFQTEHTVQIMQKRENECIARHTTELQLESKVANMIFNVNRILSCATFRSSTHFNFNRNRKSQ